MRLRPPRVRGWRQWRCVLSDAPDLRPGVFLDRDGTICEEAGYLNDVQQFRMLPCAAEAIRRLNEAKLLVVVITNQSGVGRRMFPESRVHEVHEAMMRELVAAKARVDAIYYCPHVDEDECDCRKPKPGMLRRAAVEHAIDLRRSFVVGDRYGDVEAAHRAGARGVLVRTGYGENEIASRDENVWVKEPDFVAEDLAEAVKWLLKEVR
jgi:D-glycero-D-manno-heptose 1,7-bisphosphate phosphatase